MLFFFWVWFSVFELCTMFWLKFVLILRLVPCIVLQFLLVVSFHFPCNFTLTFLKKKFLSLLITNCDFEFSSLLMCVLLWIWFPVSYLKCSIFLPLAYLKLSKTILYPNHISAFQFLDFMLCSSRYFVTLRFFNRSLFKIWLGYCLSATGTIRLLNISQIFNFWGADAL